MLMSLGPGLGDQLVLMCFNDHDLSLEYLHVTALLLGLWHISGVVQETNNSGHVNCCSWHEYSNPESTLIHPRPGPYYTCLSLNYNRYAVAQQYTKPRETPQLPIFRRLRLQQRPVICLCCLESSD